MPPILEVQNLVKKFGDFIAVDGVSFDIQAGEVFSLLGPNGAGKTTIISMLSCLLEPTSGDAIVGGHSITQAALEVKRIIGVVPQEIALYEELSARENLTFWGLESPKFWSRSGWPTAPRIRSRLTLAV
jgi:ABC-2 type transport system ATP-binding protein